MYFNLDLLPNSPSPSSGLVGYQAKQHCASGPVKVAARAVVMQLDDVEGIGMSSCVVTNTDDGISLLPEGMECSRDICSPILLERRDGKIQLIYWPDINEDEPVIVDMSKALKTNFKPKAE